MPASPLWVLPTWNPIKPPKPEKRVEVKPPLPSTASITSFVLNENVIQLLAAYDQKNILKGEIHNG